MGFPPTFFFSCLRATRKSAKAGGAELTMVSGREGVEATSGSPDGLERALAAVVGAFGLEVIDTEHCGRIVRVIVEGDAPIDLDRLAEVSKAVSEHLDAHPELVPEHRYELEVSSPGLERRLRRAAHFKRALGQRVAVRTLPGAEGERRVEGALIDADEVGFSLALDDGSTRRFTYSDVDRAHTVFDWKAALASAKRDSRRSEDAGAVR